MNVKSRKLLIPVLSLFLAFGVGCVLILSVGKNPLEAYKYLFQGAFNNLNSFCEILVKMTPMVFTSLAVIFAYRSGVLNIGGEGQVIVGAICSIAFTLRFTGILPAEAVMTLSLLLGALAGGIWGLIPGLLKAILGCNEVIICIMLNYIAILLMNYLCSGPMKESVNPQTAQIASEVRLPRLLPNVRVHFGLILAIVVSLLVFYFLFYTAHGFKLRAVGLNSNAAFANGYKIRVFAAVTMLLSGAMAGLGGSVELHGTSFRLLSGFGANYGYDGISIALISQLNPVAAIFVAFLFATLRTGSVTMQVSTGIPTSVVEIIEALVIFFVIAGTTIANYNEFKPAMDRMADKLKSKFSLKKKGA